jgi:hypothetical protein
MNEKDYCKIVFLGLINILSFLFSIVVIISASNIKLKKEILEEQSPECFGNNNVKSIIDNHYKGIAALFSFQVILFFLFFLFVIIFVFYKYLDDENKIIRYQNDNQVITNEIFTERNINENNDKKYNCDIDPQHLVKGFCFSVILCQIIYLIELILIAVLHYKINAIEISDCSILYKKNILKNYRDLIITTYIFYIFIFLPIYAILLVLFIKKKTPNPIRFFICCTHNIANFCKILSDCSKKCHTSEKLKAQNLITGKEINALTKYRDDLESLNEKLKKGIEPRDKELSDLHLLFK